MSADAIMPIVPTGLSMDFDQRKRRFTGIRVRMSDGTDVVIGARFATVDMNDNAAPGRLVDERA